MAQPEYYPLWATDDTTLPATDESNKTRPKTTLRTTGWDKGQIPSAEEFNWQLNNIYLWLLYLNEEALPTYLPMTGTSITLEGEVTGTATFSGTDALTIDATVTTDTVSSASTIVRRTTGGNIVGASVVARPLTSTAESVLYMTNSSGTTCGIVSSTQTEGTTTGYTYIRRVTPSTQAAAATIQLFDAGYITLTAPRSASAQETVDAALVRFDTLTSDIDTINNTISTNVSNLNTTISDTATALTTAYKDYSDAKSTASFGVNGYHRDVNTGFQHVWGTVTITANSSTTATATVTFSEAFPNACYSVVANTTTTTYNSSNGFMAVCACLNITTTGFTLKIDSDNSENLTVDQVITFQAVGY